VSARRARARVAALEAELEDQKAALERLTNRVLELRRELRADAQAAGAAPEKTPPVTAPVVERPWPERTPSPERAASPVERPRPEPAGPPVERPRPEPAASPVERPWPDLPPRPIVKPPPPAPVVERPWPERTASPVEGPRPERVASPAVGKTPAPPPPPSPPPRPPAAPPPQGPSGPAFDWESLVGVKLFSAIAGIALVFAAVLFLRYSVQQGWLQPPVRVLIGIVVAISLLVVCELKAARRYPATANALDAAAIAILFSTFFAAHALWNLIPAAATFALLAIVTAVAVLLSIRRESLFIAVLGLLGGFATPALLSTGENRPVPLFAYLLLLNVGLAWVAYRQRWPILTILTLVLTTVYQWGWVFQFLSQSDLTLAMGVFLIFPIVGFAGLLLARRGGRDDEDGDAFERTAMIAAALPVVFAGYLAAVPAYGARADLLFGFLACIDVGLLAITLARHTVRVELPVPLHTIGALATLVVTGVWIAASYHPAFNVTVLAFTLGFVALYLGAPAIAAALSRALPEEVEPAHYAGPLLLFVFPALAGIDPAFADPRLLFGALFVAVVLCGWRAAATREAAVYFIAAFFAVAAQAVWSVQHLTAPRLRTAVILYAAFGVLTVAVPMIARRVGRTLEPQWAGGAMVLASLGLLLFLAAGDIAPVALWALALLLAILNAGLFVESASARLPFVAQAGTVLSWVILGIWWLRAAGAVGVLPSLAVLTGLTLATLAGYGWAYGRTRQTGEAAGFANGMHLALLGHLFLFFLAVDRTWSLPPWPLFGSLAVITLATSATSLVTRTGATHAAGITAAAVIVMNWTAATAGAAGWPVVGIAASAAASAYALVWIALARRPGLAPPAAIGGAAALFISEITVTLVTAVARAPFPVIVGAHAANLSVVLALSWSQRWARVPAAAALMGAFGVLAWQATHPLATEWRELLVLAGVIYTIFTAYPLLVGPKAKGDREPWLASLISAAATFFAARAAFEAAGLAWMIGVVPIVQGLVTAVLLRALLRLEPPGQRDLGRLATVAGAALAFVTVAIPLQLDHQWITIGWALEGVALAWLYGRIPHRGLFLASTALLAVVFVRLALNPAVFTYEPRGAMRIFNWYLYTYLVAAASLVAAAWSLSRASERTDDMVQTAVKLLPAGGVILLFLLLNIEIADYYATGPEITFRFGVRVSQDLTYTIGWLVFGMLLLAAGIYLRTRPARVAAVSLIAVTTFKCFLYDLASLVGLYRVGSFVGLAMSLALVSIALQKYVLDRRNETA
jgi:hypothetical protein